MATDDADVIARVLAGERDLFRVLVARYGAIAQRTAVLCGAGVDADDVVQEAFVAAYRALRRFRTDAPFRPWLLQIVVNQTTTWSAAASVLGRSRTAPRSATST